MIQAQPNGQDPGVSPDGHADRSGRHKYGDGGHHHPHHHQEDGSGTGFRRAIRRLESLIGHSRDHGHHHQVNEAQFTSERGIKAVKISLAALLVTGVLQLVVVQMSGSVALLADTVHNFGDAMTALPLWLAFRLGTRPPNRRYTYGYGRAEDLAGVLLVLIIAFSAAVTGWQAVDRLLHPRPLTNLGWVAAAALIGMAGNELVAMYRIRVGRQIGSAALVADGLHARTDGLTSLAVLLGAIGAALGWERADPVIGLLITAAILLVLKHAAGEILFRLMERVSPELVDQAETVLSETPGVEGVEDLRIRWVGHRLRAEAKVTVDCDKTFPEAHRIAEDAHHRLLHALPLMTEAMIHANPCDHHGTSQHAAIAHHFKERATP